MGASLKRRVEFIEEKIAMQAFSLQDFVTQEDCMPVLSSSV